MNLTWQWLDDSSAAVSNVEPTTVESNSKDKTKIHPAKIYANNGICIKLFYELSEFGATSRATAVRQGKACRSK